MPRIALRPYLFALSLPLAACASAPQAPSAAPAQPATATPLQQPAPLQVQKVSASPFRADAPLNYTVKKGDTLWDLAQRFLHDPWMWPEIWYLNPQVKNPHRIYPGDVLAIVTIDGRPRLTKTLTPRMRPLPPEEAIPTLPLADLRPFLAYPQVLEARELNDAPQVVGSPDGRRILGRNDTLYAHGGALERGRVMAIVRPHKPLRDPDSGELLGYEAEAAGLARVLEAGEPSTLEIIESPRETRMGDRILPLPPVLLQDLQLKPASADLEGRVISLPDTTTVTGQWQIVALNRGRLDGLQEGHVVHLLRPGVVVEPEGERLPEPGAQEDAPAEQAGPVRLPDQDLGDALVFLVYERVSYALITQARQAVREGDIFASPQGPALAPL